MSSQPLLSVVLIAYNAGNTIEKTLRSIQGQAFPEMELLCVDDGSTDDTPDMLRKFSAAEKDFPVKIITNADNRGCLAARHIGLTHAQGEYILFVDADDTYVGGAFRLLYERMLQTGSDVCEFGVNVCPVQGHSLSQAQLDGFERYYDLKPYSCAGAEKLLTACFIEREIKVNVWNKICRTSLVRKALEDFQDEYIVMLEDWLFTFLVLSLGPKYDRICEKLINYSVGGGISTLDRTASDAAAVQQAGLFRVYSLIEENAVRRGLSPDLRKPVLDRIRSELLQFAADLFLKCTPECSQIYLDTLFRHCPVGDFLICLSVVLPKLSPEEAADVVSRLKACSLPSEIASAYVENMTADCRDPAAVEKRLRSSLTWRVGSIVTFLPRLLRRELIRMGIIKSKQ